MMNYKISINQIKVDLIRARQLLKTGRRSASLPTSPREVVMFRKYGITILDLVEAADSKQELTPFLFDDNPYVREAAKYLINLVSKS